MTSRTPMGVQPRQPPRGLASTLQVQRPSNHHQRSISSSQQQYLPTSPARRDGAVAPDSNPESADVLSARHVSTPRRQGSRLRLELSNELIAAGPLSGTESPPTLTPSRLNPLSDAMETDNMSPAMSRASQQDIDNLPVPMPKRRLPRSTRTVRSTRSAAPAATPAKKDVRPKPYTVEVPAVAPRYISTNRHDTTARDPFSKGLFSGHADFFPWSGVHHEDEWSTEAIQKGTWDRGNQSEVSSARLAIFPALKQKTGLNALSTIFMGMLNQRRHRGQITAPSTFKPPPRVTLTDTKREIWLKDLANPAISLRRLSRTIPHGIRGRTLLDQCLNKNVPTERAVWLAKCVGANEIRAFKRKGASGAFVLGGELKWIRDWTVFVEQFLESVMSAFVEPDWKPKVTYAIRLATCLYSEQLLDRDHYLEWVMSGLESSPQSRIPMWILITQIYWTDLLQSRKCGRRLVYALLNHLSTVDNDPDRDILIQISGQLSTLLNSLIKDNPESFICPPAWQRFGETLRLAMPADDPVAQTAYTRIKIRNNRLLVANTISSRGGRQYLVQLLDSTLQGKCSSELSAKCWASTEDKVGIVKTVVEWATSLHRPGLAKMYIAAGLIKSWSAFGINATSAILDVIGDVSPRDSIKKNLMIRLVSELVRCGQFSVPQYMQWLIGRGGLHDVDEIDPVDGPCASRLLVELPLHCLPEEQTSQRASLLRRAGNYSVHDEMCDTANALECVDNALGLATYLKDSEHPRKSLSLKKLLRRVISSSRAVQSAIGAHLYDVVKLHLPHKPEFVMTLAVFISIRTMMETIEDFSMLAGILKSCSSGPDVEVLAACVDTINANLDVFMAMGSAQTLFDNFIDRCKAISRDQGVVMRSLLAALSSLASRLPQREDLAKQLAQELAQNDRSNAIDACSPVSDSMAVQAQTAEGEVSEQIDKLLASGNVIDHPTMNRLFRYIAPKLEAGWVKLDGNRRVFALLLSRLRILDASHFDKLMADWISHIRTLKRRPALPELFPLLVSLGCLSISTILQTANAGSLMTEASAESPVSKSATYLQELLQLTIMKLPTTATLDAEEAYRFRIEQQSAKFEHTRALVLLIRNSMIEYSALQASEEMVQLPLDGAECQYNLLETMRSLVVADTAAVAEVLNMSTLPLAATALAHRIVTKLLLPEDDSDQHPSFDQILCLANDLTMPFCQLKLNLDLSNNLPGTADGGEGSRPRFESFAKAMDNAIESQNIMWTSMLPCLSDDITHGLNTEAHTRFLDLMPSSKSETIADDTTDANRIHLAENLLEVIEAIICGQPPSKSASLTSNLVDKLSDLCEIISSQDEDHFLAKREVLGRWLPVLLRFITLHSTSFEAANTATPGSTNSLKPTNTANHEARARIIIALCSLLVEIEALPQEITGPLSQQIFDMAVLLVDALPDDLRIQCARSILFLPGTATNTSTTSDPRMYYLFSTPRPTAAENLKLAYRDKSSIPYTAAARGMGAMYGIGMSSERLSPFVLRRWEILSEPTPNVGENDTSLSLGLFEAIKIQ
ncbi:RNA polymerase II mediator complex subunit [Conoideocrella luteorostrata]|uniref:Mediator of RNA polymerase II transcription subunit 12 n=1 Tax=Conoideocrella luteorostrata TaxID=1105319 RepID=A0AAJ0CVD9_9HYPO|nr:RNA polymerase II mediator complex subunit [Conoideocrella luteorostrata]